MPLVDQRSHPNWQQALNRMQQLVFGLLPRGLSVTEQRYQPGPNHPILECSQSRKIFRRSGGSHLVWEMKDRRWGIIQGILDRVNSRHCRHLHFRPRCFTEIPDCLNSHRVYKSNARCPAELPFMNSTCRWSSHHSKTIQVPSLLPVSIIKCLDLESQRIWSFCDLIA